MSERFDPEGSLLVKEEKLHKRLKELVEQLERQPRHAVMDEDGNVVPAKLLEWAMWMERAKQRYIARDDFGDCFVSTVFLGLNDQYMPGGPPLWFETMVFTDPHVIELNERKIVVHNSPWRAKATTKAEALEQHKKGVAWLKEHLGHAD